MPTCADKREGFNETNDVLPTVPDLAVEQRFEPALLHGVVAVALEDLLQIATNV